MNGNMATKESIFSSNVSDDEETKVEDTNRKINIKSFMEDLSKN